MVGTNTAINDHPSLTTRLWQGASPLRVTIDRRGVLNDDFAKSEVETVVYRNEILSEILYDLHKRGVQHLMVEGGSKLLQSFIDAGLWDEARVEISPQTVAESVGEEWQERVVAPMLKGAELYEEYYVEGHKMLKFLKSAHF
jgi:diaminohydroxyphosphoribosylaminopyrimidine deaminase/5-amino-6-(5-phosphoribosylamino)uracil reductase